MAEAGNTLTTRPWSYGQRMACPSLIEHIQLHRIPTVAEATATVKIKKKTTLYSRLHETETKASSNQKITKHPHILAYELLLFLFL